MFMIYTLNNSNASSKSPTFVFAEMLTQQIIIWLLGLSKNQSTETEKQSTV